MTLDPVMDWEIYCDNIERSWLITRDNSTCGDCIQCYVHPDCENIGFCTWIMDFVDATECPSNFECDGFSLY